MAEFLLVPGLESLSREDLLTLIAMQQRTIDELKVRVAELERRLGRNSGNSSMPPPSDIFTKPAKPPAPRPARKRGGQRGASGGGLALVEHPDRVEHAFPDACGGCGAGFGQPGAADSAAFTRRQRTDIPPVTTQVIETRFHTVACTCGVRTAAAVPAAVPDTPTYGPNLAALAVYLLVYQHVPVERAARPIGDLTGAAPSTGWIAAQPARATDLIAPALRLIRTLLTLGHLLHADETTTRVRAGRAWLHTARTDKLTLPALGARSRSGARALGVLDAFRGTLVHDALPRTTTSRPRVTSCVPHT